MSAPVPAIHPEISIHALREEGDIRDFALIGVFCIFLSTPSARRATHKSVERKSAPKNFYPRPPRGGRLTIDGHTFRWEAISIHALREEGDWIVHSAGAVTGYFYPRPPRGGRPQAVVVPSLDLVISIHALREEGDVAGFDSETLVDNFYPRPPRGGRRERKKKMASLNEISIHALREEGDLSGKES